MPARKRPPCLTPTPTPTHAPQQSVVSALSAALRRRDGTWAVAREHSCFGGALSVDATIFDAPGGRPVAFVEVPYLAPHVALK